MATSARLFARARQATTLGRGNSTSKREKCDAQRHSPGGQKNAADSQRGQHVNDVIRQAREIPMDPEHPVRL